jgi:hypothetical protein
MPVRKVSHASGSSLCPDGARNRTSSTYQVPVALKTPAPPARPPRLIFGTLGAAVRARATRRHRRRSSSGSAPVRAVPGRARGARPPAATAARQAAVAAAGAKRALPAPPPLRLREHWREGGDAGWEKGAGSAERQPTGSRASRSQRPALLRAPLDPALPCACPRAPTCVPPPSAGRGRWRGMGGGQHVTTGWPRAAQLGTESTGLRAGIPLLGKPSAAVLTQVREIANFIIKADNY